MSKPKNRSAKLDRIVALANSEERSWGERAGMSRKELDDALARLGELNAYRHDYQQKARAGSHFSSVHLKDYQQFLERLDEAVNAQQQIIRDSERNYETVRRHWMVKRQRLESLGRVLDKYRRDEAAFADRLEQKRLDDMPGKGDQYSRTDDG